MNKFVCKVKDNCDVCRSTINVGDDIWIDDKSGIVCSKCNNNRCGKCANCLEIERIKSRVLACANPPFSHADDDVVKVWNTELERLPCTGGDKCDRNS